MPALATILPIAVHASPLRLASTTHLRIQRVLGFPQLPVVSVQLSNTRAQSSHRLGTPALRFLHFPDHVM